MDTIKANLNAATSTKIVAKSVALHTVTSAGVGLGSVNNTADADKPISTLAQAALDTKAYKATTYTKAEVDTNIANLVAGLGADENSVTEVTGACATNTANIIIANEAIALNTAKVGITPAQASDITDNAAAVITEAGIRENADVVGYNMIVANTAALDLKVDNSTDQFTVNETSSNSGIIMKALADSPSFTDDIAAAAAGVELGELYRTYNVVKIRLPLATGIGTFLRPDGISRFLRPDGTSSFVRG